MVQDSKHWWTFTGAFWIFQSCPNLQIRPFGGSGDRSGMPLKSGFVLNLFREILFWFFFFILHNQHGYITELSPHSLCWASTSEPEKGKLIPDFSCDSKCSLAGEISKPPCLSFLIEDHFCYQGWVYMSDLSTRTRGVSQLHPSTGIPWLRLQKTRSCALCNRNLLQSSFGLFPPKVIWVLFVEIWPGQKSSQLWSRTRVRSLLHKGWLDAHFASTFHHVYSNVEARNNWTDRFCG